jgi:hypothetical protein
LFCFFGMNSQLHLTCCNWPKPRSLVTYLCACVCVCVCVYTYMCIKASYLTPQIYIIISHLKIKQGQAWWHIAIMSAAQKAEAKGTWSKVDWNKSYRPYLKNKLKVSKGCRCGFSGKVLKYKALSSNNSTTKINK